MCNPSGGHTECERRYTLCSLRCRKQIHGGTTDKQRNEPQRNRREKNKTFARGRENTLLCLEYAELYAPSLGLGTCWAGMLEAAAFAGYPPVLELLRLPAGTVLTGALMVGFPNLSFQRLVDRQPLDITFVEA